MIGIVGLLVLIGIAFAMSNNRRAALNWRVLLWGLGIPVAIGLFSLRTPIGQAVFATANRIADAFVGFTNAGVNFVFGNWPAVTVVGQPPPAGAPPGVVTGEPVVVGFIFAIKVLPIIVFVACVMAILYHLGIMQRIVALLARGLVRTMRISGAEALSTIGDIFLGMTEAPLLVRPYVARMTDSELFTLMVAGMATVSGSTLFAYVALGIDAGYLVTASFMSAPVAVMLAKIMVPETSTPVTLGTVQIEVPRLDANVIDAAARGAHEGMHMALNVGAMLIAFVALVHMADAGIGAVGGWFGHPEVRLSTLLGWPLAPIAWLMGVPWHEAPFVGALLGSKTVLNEFIAYRELATQVATLSPGTVRIASFALCGFANLGSLGILLGGLGSLVPERRGDLARFGLRSIVAGTLATCITGTLAGLIGPG
ncbi:MAG TPA: nucleoside transporter C-terminal domain-containing protein [Polyangia bacterium]